MLAAGHRFLCTYPERTQDCQSDNGKSKCRTLFGDDEETTIELLMKWLAFSLSVFVVARLTDSVHIRTVGTALAVAAVYGVLKVLPGV